LDNLFFDTVKGELLNYKSQSCIFWPWNFFL